jgi:thymidine kinase
MAKLYFRYGAMNSGKSTAMLQAAYNYEERGQQVLLAKPQVDTKGDREIVSRLGVSRPVDFVLSPDADAYQEFSKERARVKAESGLGVSCLLVDEAQFLTESQVDDLLRIAVLDGVPVLAYGIRTDFQTVAFPGSRRLLEVSHAIEELKTICRCGRKAVFNARKVGDRFVFDGDQVAIDGVDVTYESLCGACYLEESGGLLGSGRRRILVEPAEVAYSSAPDADFA